MRVKIYNISPKRDSGKLFTDKDMMKSLFGEFKVEPEMYDEVFNAELDTKDLEEIFQQFNTTHHPLFRGHSLSVSDVVVTEDGAFFCDAVGFEKIDFDESKTQKPDNLMRIVYIEPNKPAYEAEVADGLESLQKAVGGIIEPIYNDDNTIMIGNDEAKLIGMKGNRHLDNGTSIIAGNFFVIGDGGETFRSLTEEETQKYLKKYAVPEEITDEETQSDVGFTIIGV